MWGTLVLKETEYLQEIFGNPQNLLISQASEELADDQPFTEKALTYDGAGPYGCSLRSLTPLLNPISLISYSSLAPCCHMPCGTQTFKVGELHARSLMLPTVS